MPAYNENLHDSADPLLLKQMTAASELMDRIVLLGAKIIAMQDADEVDHAKIHYSVSPEVREIEEELHYLPNYTYSIQGKGFVPLADSRNLATTTYANIPEITGTIHSLVMFDPREVEYTTREELLDELGISESEAEGMLLDRAISNSDAIARITDPESGLRLFIDFLVDHRTDVNQCVGGIAVRSNDVTFHNIIDAASLRVNSMYQLASSEHAVPQEDLVEVINVYSIKARQIINDNKFRRMSHRGQRRIFEKLIHEANAKAALDRYTAVVKPERVYRSVLQDGRRIPQEITYFDDMTPITVQPLRLDFFEMYGLAQGKRIFNDRCVNNKYDGLCIVADTQAQLPDGEKVGIIWIPVCSQALEMSFFEKD